MFTLKRVFQIGGVLAAACCAMQSRADMVTYSDGSSWSAAVTGVQDVTIPDPAPSPYTLFGLSSGIAVTYSGVTFTQETTGYFYDLSPSFYPIPGPVLTEEAAGAGTTASILITLPSATTGIAFDFGNYSSATITLSNGDVDVTNPNNLDDFNGYNTPQFFGITDTSSFHSVLISNSDYYDLTIANVAYAPAEISATPEASYRTLLILMLFGLYLRRRIVAARRSLP